MQLEDEPIQIPPGEWASYESDGSRGYELFEIYNNTDDTQTAVLITWIMFEYYLPRKLRWRKRRKFINAHGAAVLEDAVQKHFPTARYLDNDEGAIAEFSIDLPPGVQPIPTQVEERLLTETQASRFYDQVHNPESPLNREVRHRLYMASVGTEWQKYFADWSV